MLVLFVDDEQDVRDTFSALLQMWGYEVACCAGEQEATEYVREHGDRIDIALLDMKMENDDSGLRLVKLLRAGHAGVPCVVLTAFADLDGARIAMEAGAFSYVPKERAVDLLPTAIRNAARQRQATQTLDLRERLGCQLARYLASAMRKGAGLDTKAVTAAAEVMKSLLMRSDPTPAPSPADHTVSVSWLLQQIHLPKTANNMSPHLADAKILVPPELRQFPGAEHLHECLKHLGHNASHPMNVTASEDATSVTIGFSASTGGLKPQELACAQAAAVGDTVTNERDASIASFAACATSLRAVTSVELDSGGAVVIKVRIPKA